MKKFLTKSAMFLLIIFTFFFSLNYFYLQTNTYKNSIINNDTSKFAFVPDKLKIINFGSSHGRDGFVYQDYGDKLAFNFALSSQTLNYDFNVMRNYEKCFQKDTVVFIPVSYFSLYWEEFDKDFESRNKKYYDFLAAKYIDNCNRKYFYLNKFLPVMTLENADISKALFEKVSLIDINKDNRFRVATDIEDLEKSARLTYENHISSFKPNNPVINTRQGESLENILKLCKTNNWQAILVTTPFLDIYNKCYPDEFFICFTKDIQYFAEKYQVPYLDYSRDERFENNLQLFANPDHLNLQGGKLFTSIVMEDIKKLEIEPQI